MAFFEKIEVKDGIIGIWEITEDVDSLLDGFVFADAEKQIFSSFASERRKKEFVIVRLLLQELLGEKPEIIYENCGRPVLKNFDWQLSISHSKDFVVVFLSKRKIGIDVEELNRKIENVASRFLHETEIGFVKESSNSQETMMLLWCAKEAIFKCSEAEGIHFNREILIPPFVQKEGQVFFGENIQSHKSVKYCLQHFIRKNNVVVFCVEEEEK